jgi:hypothetical protein
VALVLELPKVMRYVRRYVQCNSIAEAFSDGIAEMWGDSIDDVRRAPAEPRYLEVIRPDEEKFLDLPNCVFMVTEEVSMKE